MQKCILFKIIWLCLAFISYAAVKPRVKYEYYLQGETVLLKCMSNANEADWIGPAQANMPDVSPLNEIDIYGKCRKWNTSLYATNDKINPNLPHKNRLKIDVNETGDFNLQIRQFSKYDAGLYICQYTNENKHISTVKFILQEKTYPSKIIFQNATKENVINGVAYKSMNIKCSVESGKPPETLYLIRDNNTVKIGMEHGNIEYTFKPTQLDHNSIYTCEANNPLFIQPLRRNVRLNIKYKPVVSIINLMTEEITEGEKMNICCYVESNPAPQSTRLLNGSQEILIKNNVKDICFLIERVSRYDRGSYTFIAENEIGNGSATMIFNVKYPPDVHLNYKNFTINDEMRSIQCTAKGFPSNYTYGVWEHRSEFNELIRYLNSTNNGTLILPRIYEAVDQYQDSGYYICMVTNGIPNNQHLQQGKAYVVSEGPPVFVYQNSAIQYGVIGKKVTIRLYILSYSKIECIAVRAVDGVVDVNYVHDTYKKPLKVLDIFHGQIISVNGIEVEFVFARLEQKHFRIYRITVCNTFGNESYTLSLVPRADNFLEEGKKISSERIVIVVLLTLIMFLLVLMGLYVRYLKKRYRKRMITTTTDQTADSAHYTEIIEDNNVLSTLQEGNNQMISTDARIVFENRNMSIDAQHVVFTNNESDTSEHSIGSSDNEINASEQLDDGYEQPYTSLVAHNYAENEHGYSSTKTNSINDNSTTLQNATFRSSFEFIEQYPSKDKQNIFFFPDDGQENVNLKSGEYINLSLKQ